MSKTAMMIAGMAVAGALLCTAAEAASYGPWYNLGSGVSVRFANVGSGQTWQFRNNGPKSIVLLRFTYTDRKGTHPDVLPVTLKVGQGFGGWGSFLSTGKVTRLQIREIKRK